MSVSEKIRNKLIHSLGPERVEVIDESHLHAGHAGAREGGESHFRVLIVSKQFEGASRVARQRMVNSILREELAGPVHALAMKTLTPQEFAKEE
ncbi:BolA family protein [Hyphococcus formosus]|uniref:BolA family protein n=1 Tax=Hyphococcus formosus TaxID=3143534 RepID=UPI00398B427B